jgi:hypothetical protein
MMIMLDIGCPGKESGFRHNLDIILKIFDASVCDGGINMHVHLVGILTLSVLISGEMWGKFSHVQRTVGIHGGQICNYVPK